MTRPTSSPRLFSSFHVLALGIAISCLSFIATSASHAAASTGTVTAAKRTPAAETQLADEITRRLRRIGLNFNRGRLPRPYDPDGEIC